MFVELCVSSGPQPLRGIPVETGEAGVVLTVSTDAKEGGGGAGERNGLWIYSVWGQRTVQRERLSVAECIRISLRANKNFKC